MDNKRFDDIMFDIDGLNQEQATELVSTLCHLHADLIVRGASKIVLTAAKSSEFKRLSKKGMLPVKTMCKPLPAPKSAHFEEGEGFVKAMEVGPIVLGIEEDNNE